MAAKAAGRARIDSGDDTQTLLRDIRNLLQREQEDREASAAEACRKQCLRGHYFRRLVYAMASAILAVALCFVVLLSIHPLRLWPFLLLLIMPVLYLILSWIDRIWIVEPEVQGEKVGLRKFLMMGIFGPLSLIALVLLLLPSETGSRVSHHHSD